MNQSVADDVLGYTIINQTHLRFIFQQRYHLRQACVVKSKWRRQIAESFIVQKIGNADEFIRAWEYLEKQELI